MNTSKPKCYVLCIDAFPDIPELKEKLSSFQRAELVCAGAFTTATMTSMICGTVPSDIIPGGIGYNTHYTERFLSWRKNGTALCDKVLESGKDVIIHNHVPWMSHNIIGNKISTQASTQHYRDHTINNDGVEVLKVDDEKIGVKLTMSGQEKSGNLIYSSSHPDLTLNTFLEWGSDQRRKQFYNNEYHYFHNIPHDFSGLIWSDLCHFHESVYYKDGSPYAPETKGLSIKMEDSVHDSVAWLDSFDFDSPNSIFIIYADHSHRVEPYLDPIGYITWCYIKDNRPDAKSLRPVISSYDIYSLVLDVLGIANENTNLKSELPTLKYNPDRIYYTEDGRADATVKDRATTYTKTQLVGDIWVSVSHVTDGAKIAPGWYLKVAERNKLCYDLYHTPEGQGPDQTTKMRIRCTGPLSNIVKEQVSLEWPSKEVIEAAQKLDWPSTK